MRVLTSGLLLAGLIAVYGCGSSGYTPVTGTVLLDGTPLPDASVAFVPDDPSGEGATGYTDSNGRFTMASTRTDGVRPGKYKVRIEALAEQPSPDSKSISEIMSAKYGGGGQVDQKTAGKDSAQAYKDSVKAAGAQGKKGRATPALYNDITKTPLRAEVPATTDFKFELTKDGK